MSIFNYYHIYLWFQASRKLPRDLPIHDDTRHSVKDISSLGSRRQSIGDWSVGSGRSMTSQSDNRSYRERLRDRIQNVKVSMGALWYPNVIS